MFGRFDDNHPHGVTVRPTGPSSREVARDIDRAAERADKILTELVNGPKRRTASKPGKRAR
jgi:hypothetical protein